MNRKIKRICGIAALVAFVILGIAAGYIYTTKYKVENIDTSMSPTGEYELFFNSVGEPDWPFGYSHAQLVLKKGTDTIKKIKFDVANDGGTLCEENWSAEWEPEEDVTCFFFDGKTEKK